MAWETETSTEKINRLRSELQSRQQELSVAQEELEELEDDLRAFEFEFEAHMGQLLEELTILEAEIENYMGLVKQKRTEERFGYGYQSVEDQFVDKWNTNPREEEPKIRINTKPKQAEKPTASKIQIKKLYRKLARHFHPDLAIDEEDKKFRTAKMAAINDAYKAKSMAELLAIAEEMESEDIFHTAQHTQQTAEQMIEALQTEILKTDKQIAWIKNELQNFHNRPMVELALEVKLANRDGRNLIEEMVAELQKKIARKQVERDMVASQFHNL